MAELPCGGVEPDHNGHNHSYRANCPWMYEELRAWRRRGPPPPVVTAVGAPQSARPGVRTPAGRPLPRAELEAPPGWTGQGWRRLMP